GLHVFSERFVGMQVCVCNSRSGGGSSWFAKAPLVPGGPQRCEGSLHASSAVATPEGAVHRTECADEAAVATHRGAQPGERVRACPGDRVAVRRWFGASGGAPSERSRSCFATLPRSRQSARSRA